MAQQQGPRLDKGLGLWVMLGWGLVILTLVISLWGVLALIQGIVNPKTILAAIVFAGVVAYVATGIGRIPNDYRQVVLVLGLRWTIWESGIKIILRGLMDTPKQYMFSVRDITLEKLRTKFQIEISNTTVEVSADATVRSTDILRTLFSVAASSDDRPGHRVITEDLAPAAIRAAIQTHLSTLLLADVRAMRQQDLLKNITTVPSPDDKNKKIPSPLIAQLDRWGLVLSTCVVNVDERAATQQARDAQFALIQAFEAVLATAKSVAGLGHVPDNQIVRGSANFEAVREAFPEAFRLFVTQKAFDNPQVLQVLNESVFTALLGQRFAGGAQPQQPRQGPQRQRR